MMPKAALPGDTGILRLGPDITCYGRSSAGYLRSQVGGLLDDVSEDVVLDSRVYLPFDPTELIENLCMDRAMRSAKRAPGICIAAREGYYLTLSNLAPLSTQTDSEIKSEGVEAVAFPKLADRLNR